MTSRLSSNNKKKRILFVDDKPDLTSLLEIALERVGFDVDTFNDPFLVLKSFRPSLYDLIILDIIMPKVDGFVLYKQIKKVDPDATVCFLTASEKYREELRKEEYCALDVDLFIRKPISTIGLIREITARIKVTQEKKRLVGVLSVCLPKTELKWMIERLDK